MTKPSLARRVAACSAVRTTVSLLAAATIALPVTATAQSWPTKPIRLLVGFAPGGGTDIVMRAIAPKLGELLGQQIVVENRAGASGTIAADQVAKSAPDGYTLVMATFAHAVNPSLIAKLPFDTEKAFAPVVMVARGPNVLVVRADSPLKTLKDVMDTARAQPGKLSYASQGNGTSAHLAGEMFENLAKVKMTHVPYRGAGPAMTDLLGGQVDMMFATAAAAGPHVAAGKLRALAVTTPERSPVMRAVPTVAEFVTGYAVESWYGLFAPAGTPADVISKLNVATKQATQSADFKKKLEPEGLIVSTGSPQELEDYVRKEEARWRKIVTENNIKPD